MANFEKAVRMKLRFDTPKGQLSVEELWDIPLESEKGVSLDGLAVALHQKIKSGAEVSFVRKDSSKSAEYETVQLKFDIVKHIIDIRVAEKEAAEKSRANRAQKQRILELIAQKQDESLAGKSVEELMAMVDQLDG